MRSTNENITVSNKIIENSKESRVKLKPAKSHGNPYPFFSYIRLMDLPTQVEIKNHSIRIHNPNGESFSLSQKYEFTHVFSPSTPDFMFYQKMFENFTEISELSLIIAVYGKFDLKKLIHYLKYDCFYLFDFSFDIIDDIIEQTIELAHEETIQADEISLETYVVPKILLLQKNNSYVYNSRHVVIYIADNLSILRSIKKYGSSKYLQNKVILISQVDKSLLDLNSSLFLSLSLSTKSLVSPSPKKIQNMDHSLSKSAKITSTKTTKTGKLSPIFSTPCEYFNNEYLTAYNKNNQNFFKLDSNAPKQSSQSNTPGQKFYTTPNITEMNQITSIIPTDDQNISNLLQINEDIENEGSLKNEESLKNEINFGHCSKVKNYLLSMNNKVIEEMKETLQIVLSRSEKVHSKTSEDLINLQNQQNILIHEQSIEAEILRNVEQELESLQAKLNNVRSCRENLITEKEKLHEFVKKSIELTNEMKQHIRSATERSNGFARKIEEMTQNEILFMEASVTENIKTCQASLEMEILHFDINAFIDEIIDKQNTQLNDGNNSSNT
ncbi:hypothetical protein TRFO_35518 [Tritrichomonas foetus]|uniref:Uncharacterized protein n=1 Tax=Tritrichomonas foetus TaxID=1144522 RepID=A0A1J4JKL2_9EUKA|nr:hypothetical protein TRFO_35518 [Tritrichomonas foetus]|eukprot:OHS98101.1 hypothetical protein TRFO_35518 [Tritrichomonas foetus]